MVSTVKKISRTNFDFLCGCDSLDVWQGSIQGVRSSDSTGPYIMGGCCGHINYDVIVFSKERIPPGKASDVKKRCIVDSIPGAYYYVFEVRKEKKEVGGKALDAFDYVFPDKVEVYKKYEDGWYLINTEWVRNFEELGQLKLKTIFTKG